MADRLVIVAVIGHAAARSAHGEGGADDGGQADLFQRVEGDLHACFDVIFTRVVLGGGDDGGFGVFDAQTVHGFAEKLAVLGHFDGGAGGADHLDAEFFQHAQRR